MTIKEYRKTATIKAEKFDGSDEMMEKYGLYEYVTEGFEFLKEVNQEGKRIAYIHTKEGYMELNEGDYIATGINGEHWAIKPDIFEKTYQEVGNDIKKEW